MIHPRRIFLAVGEVTRLISLTTIIPAAIALFYEPFDSKFLGIPLPENFLVFIATSGAFVLFWLIAKQVGRGEDVDDLVDREAYLAVALSWPVVAAISTMPMLLSGTARNFGDAWFEAMSGLTTTGATVFGSQLAEMDPSIMIWRGQLQFIGGLAIVVLSVAVLARLSHGGLQLLQTQAPGTSVNRLGARLVQTGRTLWATYLALTALLFAILISTLVIAKGVVPKTAFLDALFYTYTILSTGGFTAHQDPFAYFDSRFLEGVIVLFMVIGGSNLALVYHGINKRHEKLLKNTEWRTWILGLAIISLVLSGIIWRSVDYASAAFSSSFRLGIFSVVSASSTSGFTLTPMGSLPSGAQIVILLLMLVGATAGSTGGGLKVVRAILLVKLVQRQVRKLLHPRAVIPVRLGRRVLKDQTILTAVAFFFAYMTVAMGGSIFLMIVEPSISLIEGVAASASMIGNVGPGLGELGTASGYESLQWQSKMVLSILMWFGRLEIFAALLLLSPNGWRN